MELEKLATSAVVAELSKTDRLSSFINSGDKEPCWDGNIYIHEGKNRTKKNIKKVATQVKGKAVLKDAVKDKIKYPISKDDLNAYMMNGGTFFFVVYIDKNSGNTLQIYYSPLLPVKIGMILAKDKEKYQIEFQRFPENNLEKTEIFINFYENAQKQASFAGKKLPSIQELHNQGILDSLTINYTGLGNSLSPSSFPKIIDGKSLTIYANVKGGTVPIPVEYYESIHHVMMSNDDDLPVSVNGKKYYDNYTIITTAENIEIRIGSCMKIISPNVEVSELPLTVNVEININGSLRERIIGIKFITAVIQHKIITIGDKMFCCNIPESLLSDKKRENLSDLLASYERVQAVLEFMNVKRDLNLQKCSEEDIRNLNLLVDSIAGKKPVKELPKDTNRVYTLSIANLNLAIKYIKNTNGYYYIMDYFGNHFELYWILENNKSLRMSQFFSMTSDDFIKFDNLNLKTIIDDYREIEPHNELISQGNRTMLEMLNAYDQVPSYDLLEASKQMLAWLKSHPDYIEPEICQINELQIILRERPLNFDEKASLYVIIKNSPDTFIKIGSFLLLDEQEEAQKLFDTLTEDEVNNFKKFPICKFYRKGETKENLL